MSTLELPPRRSSRTQEMTIRRNRTSLEILLQMGFPKHRAEKALAATGDKGVQLACDWLLSHVSDPMLDDPTQRDYILYLCPVGQLQQEFLDYWQKSYRECGWNRAHNYFPHITLCSFFQADNSLVSQLSHTIKRVTERVCSSIERVEFDYFSSANFVGLFVKESFSQILKKITTDFADEMKKSGVTIELHKKQLHISLAYQFSADKKERLEALAKTINLDAPARWDLRLYSRDRAMDQYQVRRVLYTYTPRAADELEMCDGDFFYVKETEIESSTDGWYVGTSWLTGCSGMIPGAYTERTAETETWTMHRSIPIVGTDLIVKTEQNGPPQWTTDQNNAAVRNSANVENSHLDRKASLASSLPVIPEGVDVQSTASVSRTLAKVEKPLGEDCYSPLPDIAVSHSKSASDSPVTVVETKPSVSESDSKPVSEAGETSQKIVPNADSSQISVMKSTGRNNAVTTHGMLAAKGPRQLFIVRHGERIDFTFGKNWIQYCFNQQGDYIRHDLNMPSSVPKRQGGPEDFSLDCPITVQGHFQARLLGEAMQEKNIEISHVYTSPSLRCVETACSILEGLNEHQEINVEPGLFEWLDWYKVDLPKFMSSAELLEAGYSVNSSYIPIWPYSKYNTQETVEQFYDRCCHVTKEILKRHESQGGSIFLVSHGINLDSCTRRLVGQTARSPSGFHEVLKKIPYCAVAVAQEATVVRDMWYLIEPPVLPFAHTSNFRYNWTLLTLPTSV